LETHVDRLQLVVRSLVYHRRIHLPVLLGVALATAVLTGALLVGDSLRGSLRVAALGRLGRVDAAIEAPGFFRAALAEDLAAATHPDQPADVCALIFLAGSATHADTHATAHGVNVLGIDASFWKLGAGPAVAPANSEARGVVLNQALAAELRATIGDDILLRVRTPTSISAETLVGRRDAAATTLRLTVANVIPERDLGAFTLNLRQAQPRSAYVPLDTLQRALDRRERANTLLVAGRNDVPLRGVVTLADMGLRLRESDELRYVSLESENFLLAPAVEAAAREAAAALHCPVTAILTYLANRIAVAEHAERSIPYSTVTALDVAPGAAETLPPLAAGEILLNEWAARELAANIGENICLTYYISGPLGRLDTQSASFRLRGVVPLAGLAADAGLTPDYPGVTDARSLAEWDPPFPIDLTAIRPQDEAYWRQHRATPKAFVTLADGQRLWAADGERFGQLTALRFEVPAGASVAETRAALEQELRARLDPAELGWRVDELRQRALDASEGTTDFSGLLLGFSGFLIISAVLLVALLFRLNTEHRAAEIGLLLAVGFSPAGVRRVWLVEGTAIAAAGALAGLPLARLYAELLLIFLWQSWSGALDLPPLAVYATWSSYAWGFCCSGLVAVAALAATLRGLVRRPCRALLAGSVCADAAGPKSKPIRGMVAMAAGLALAGAATIALSAHAAAGVQAALFFAAGTAWLGAVLLVLAAWLRSERGSSLRPGATAILRLGVRNARRHPGRSLLTAGLIAAATFVLAALEVMRLDVAPGEAGRDSATGGYGLWAEADVPLHEDLNTPAGRTALDLSSAASAALDSATVMPLRVHAGDEISCRSLARPTQPRVLGVPDEFTTRGGFAFAGTLAETADERHNPWNLLHRTLPDGVIPAIADEASARWQLHLNLGDELPLSDEHGRTVRLRLVALLRGSIFQDAVLIGESDFVRLFPAVDGYAMFLVTAPPDRTPEIEAGLERELSQHGVAVTPTAARLAEFGAVQNSYLATFQMLGGLGLLLGTVGLAVVLVRNVGERRAELALLLAVGFSPGRLSWMLLAENGVLLGAGVLGGLLSAGVAVLPHMIARGNIPPWAPLLLMLATVVCGGLLAAGGAVRGALRTPLLPALRAE
jgi:ABC-type lipoprotein release transport system permease subunit